MTEPNLLTFKDLLVEDDASRYLDELSAEERRPEYIRNRLPDTSTMFTEEEVDLAFQIFSPDKS